MLSGNLLGNIFESLLGILLLFVLFGFPLFLTLRNIIKLFMGKERNETWIYNDILIIIFGPLYTLVLYTTLQFKDWNIALQIPSDELKHAPISSEHMITFVFLWIVAIIGFLLLKKKEKLPPLASVLCVSAMYIGCALSVVTIIQFSNISSMEVSDFLKYSLLCLFPLNFIILTLSTTMDMMRYFKDNSVIYYNSKILSFISTVITKGINLPVFALIFICPLFAICVVVLLVFGQQPDSIVKAFTETSDWVLSQKISPPTVYYDGHYLCTVAAGGHKKVVKPQRMGVRHGHKIVVNRQLCVANAFEQLISERTPKFHKFIRHVYDKYGYPISKHIKTPIAADITYIIMKPLEWIFLVVLYLFDLHPESRIARQYLPKIPSREK